MQFLLLTKTQLDKVYDNLSFYMSAVKSDILTIDFQLLDVHIC